ncbi:MAG: hypothetical protein QY330_00125 [Candidatus Dojkabacteria bacterium]|uniref:Uncharacterized protein n=2 Tax=Candidatus Dojkabacteria TaxID=74243 RepID=A0A136KKR8_9BACT|nr:MAG: hypothetical protein UZ20_WS6002000207 [candidate division WS6 bacterium OLB21]MBW7953874.1 hypothetical protein [Candidatus Dojkabacteria bacterium]WKZ28001.1 MAG: hypothetical protein QY330_00125 [Candidatus Dojkabacteria bacterium]
MINNLQCTLDNPLFVEGNNGPVNDTLLDTLRAKVVDVLGLNSTHGLYENHRSAAPRIEKPLLGNVSVVNREP